MDSRPNEVIICILFLLCSIFHIKAQSPDTLSHKTLEINKPSMVSTHPFGIFFSRWQGNFKSAPTQKVLLDLSFESGNVWSPPVTSYIPNNQADRDFISQFPWFNREFAVDVDTLDAKTLEIQNDGVIKGLRINLIIPLNLKSELRLGLRSFMLTNGRFPFSIFTSDDTIEFFHDNIAGGDDPFDRKLYPLNRGRIRYKDRNDRKLDIDHGDLILSGFEFSYYYYFKDIWPAQRYLTFNLGLHSGWNTSKYNQSIDLGLTVNALKSYELKPERYIHIGIGLGASRNSLIALKSSNMDFATNDFIGFLESGIAYSFKSSKNTMHSIAVDFYIQTSLNKKSESDYIIPTKNGIGFKSWNSGTSNLYRNNNYWALIYSFGKKVITSLYVQQDLTVNNNPDIQTGIGLKFGL